MGSYASMYQYETNQNQSNNKNLFKFPGVADGVGGWRSYGIDPGEFSSFLMKTCERLVQSANFCPKQPVTLLAYSYCELLEQKKPILGKSFAQHILQHIFVTCVSLKTNELCLFIDLQMSVFYLTNTKNTITHSVNDFR